MTFLAGELAALAIRLESADPDEVRGGVADRLHEIARALRQDAPAALALQAAEGAHRAAVELGAQLASTGRHDASHDELALIAQTQALAAIAGALTRTDAGDGERLTGEEEVTQVARRAIVGLGGPLAQAVVDALEIHASSDAGGAQAEAIRAALDGALRRLAADPEHPGAPFGDMLYRILAPAFREGLSVLVRLNDAIPRGTAQSYSEPGRDRLVVEVHSFDLAFMDGYEPADCRLVTPFGVADVEEPTS